MNRVRVTKSFHSANMECSYNDAQDKKKVRFTRSRGELVPESQNYIKHPWIISIVREEISNSTWYRAGKKGGLSTHCKEISAMANIDLLRSEKIRSLIFLLRILHFSNSMQQPCMSSSALSVMACNGSELGKEPLISPVC